MSWLQATGALASIVFFLVLLQLSGAHARLSGLATVVGAALLLAVVVVEAALLEAVPMAAAAGDQATVATTFALSNGVFARIFPLPPPRCCSPVSGSPWPRPACCAPASGAPRWWSPRCS